MGPWNAVGVVVETDTKGLARCEQWWGLRLDQLCSRYMAVIIQESDWHTTDISTSFHAPKESNDSNQSHPMGQSADDQTRQASVQLIWLLFPNCCPRHKWSTCQLIVFPWTQVPSWLGILNSRENFMSFTNEMVIFLLIKDQVSHYPFLARLSKQDFS